MRPNGLRTKKSENDTRKNIGLKTISRRIEEKVTILGMKRENIKITKIA